MSHVVREATPADADALGRVHVLAWQAACRGGLMPDEHLDGLSVADRTALWAEALERSPRPRSIRLVAEAADGEVVGFVLLGPAGSDPETGELHGINVAPDRWRVGAGSALMRAGLEWLAEAGFTDAVLWVHPGNTRARLFYEDHGWVHDGVDRRQEVLGVVIPETRYSTRIGPATRE
jgi:GNAT superfamily N-acetyltransferase